MIKIVQPSSCQIKWQL